jgi:hypothetical protein
MIKTSHKRVEPRKVHLKTELNSNCFGNTNQIQLQFMFIQEVAFYMIFRILEIFRSSNRPLHCIGAWSLEEHKFLRSINWQFIPTKLIDWILLFFHSWLNRSTHNFCHQQFCITRILQHHWDCTEQIFFNLSDSLAILFSNSNQKFEEPLEFFRLETLLMETLDTNLF